MLTGFAFIGLLAAMAPVLALFGGGDGEVEPDLDTNGDASPEDLPAEADLLDDLADDAAPPRQPVDYEYPLGAGDHEISDFVPGDDSLFLTSETWDFSLAELHGPDGGAALDIILGGDSATLSFPELATLPVEDIFVWVTEAGMEPVLLTLSDALDEDGEDEGPLQPTDPDSPDVPQPPIGGVVPVAPSDPDAPDGPLADPSSAPPLAPTDPDAPDP